MEYSTLYLKKDTEIVGVIAMTQDEKTAYFIGKVADIAGKSGDTLPFGDVASGEGPIQGYPRAVMLSYYKTGEFPVDYDIEYGS